MVSRREFVSGAIAAASVTSSQTAKAQAYPTRPVRFMVGFPAGGPNDILARLMGQWLSERLGQPFAVENRPGRSGNVATEEVVRAPADGYTILLVGPANAISGSLYQNLSFNFLRDIAPVAGITREPLVMLVHPSVPAKTVAEFIAYAKANPAAQDGVDRQRQLAARVRRAVQDHDRRRDAGRALCRRRARAEGDDRGRGADDVRADVGVDRARQDRQAAPAGGDHIKSFAGVARHPDPGRRRARLRGERGDRHRSAEGYAGRDRRARSTRRSTRPSPIPR